LSGNVIIWGGVGLYLAALLVVGLLASRNVKDSTDFILAGRRLPLLLCTFTPFASWFGAGTCIGAAGAAYHGGLLAVIADPFGAGLCLLLAGFFYMRGLNSLDDGFDASPAIVDKEMYLRGYRYLYRISED
jgi:Na+/proline symporter